MSDADFDLVAAKKGDTLNYAALSCAVLYCSVLCYTVLSCTVLYCTELCCAVPYFAEL
jgi:hypothetical protein